MDVGGHLRPASLSVSELRARRGIKWHRFEDDVLPAWIAELDYAVPEPIVQALRALADEAAYGYEDVWLGSELADVFASYMQRRFGWSPGTEHVLPVIDLVQALYASVAAFTRPDQGVIVHTPIYPPFLSAIGDMDRRVVENRLLDTGSGYALDRDGLAHVAAEDQTPLLLLCNPHNPTGRVFTRAELEGIANVVLERDLVVVADEVHADLIYPGHTHVPFATLSPEIARRTVTITSATKAYNIPGLRCGLMHFGSAELRDRLRRVLPDRLIGVAHHFGMLATIVAWRECEPWLAALMQRLDHNRQRLVTRVARDLPGVRTYAPQATYLSWLDCRALELPASPFAFFETRARVGLSDGADFGPPGRGFARLNFGTSETILDEILDRLRDAIAVRG